MKSIASYINESQYLTPLLFESYEEVSNMNLDEFYVEMASRIIDGNYINESWLGDKMRKFASKVNKFADKSDETVDNVKQKVSDVKSSVSDKVKYWSDAAKDAIDTIKSKFGEKYNQYKDVIVGLINEIETSLKNFGEDMVGLFKALGITITSPAVAVAQGVIYILQRVPDAVQYLKEKKQAIALICAVLSIQAARRAGVKDDELFAKLAKA